MHGLGLFVSNELPFGFCVLNRVFRDCDALGGYDFFNHFRGWGVNLSMASVMHTSETQCLPWMKWRVSVEHDSAYASLEANGTAGVARAQNLGFGDDLSAGVIRSRTVFSVDDWHIGRCGDGGG